MLTVEVAVITPSHVIVTGRPLVITISSPSLRVFHEISLILAYTDVSILFSARISAIVSDFVLTLIVFSVSVKLLISVITISIPAES